MNLPTFPNAITHPDTQKQIGMNTESSTFTIALVVHLSQLHLVLMVLSVPLMICVPHGCLFEQGNLRMVSDGFKANSAFSTALWGSGIAWVTAVRYLGIASAPLFYSCLSNICLVITTYSAFLTLRYDTLEDYHVLFAIFWIVSAFLTHFSVTLRSQTHRTEFTPYLFWGGVLCGTVFISLFVGIVLDQRRSLYDIKLVAEINDVQLLTTISILEILTIYTLFALDFILSMQVLNIYVDGVNLLQIVESLSTIYRIPMKIAIFTGYSLVVVYGAVWLSKMM